MTILVTYIVLQCISFVSSISLVCGTINVRIWKLNQNKILNETNFRNDQSCWLHRSCRKRFWRFSGFWDQRWRTTSTWRCTRWFADIFGSASTRFTSQWIWNCINFKRARFMEWERFECSKATVKRFKIRRASRTAINTIKWFIWIIIPVGTVCLFDTSQ